MKPVYILCIFILVLLLAACSTATPATLSQPAVQPEATSPAQPSTQPVGASPTQPSQPVGQAIMQLPERSDAQGAVEVVVKPLNLGRSEETLKFDVSLNTHSVNLSMNLATLSTLTTDTGKTVQAIQWDAPVGGHHVAGTLAFPMNVDGKPLLDGASKLTLTIKNVDAPERSFVWDLK